MEKMVEIIFKKRISLGSVEPMSAIDRIKTLLNSYGVVNEKKEEITASVFNNKVVAEIFLSIHHNSLIQIVFSFYIDANEKNFVVEVTGRMEVTVPEPTGIYTSAFRDYFIKHVLDHEYRRVESRVKHLGDEIVKGIMRHYM